MPEDHQNYIQWSSDRFISWAKNIGESTEVTVRSILSANKIEQQGFRSCMALLKLVDKYSVVRVEAACRKALSYTPKPSYKSVKTILSTGQDKLTDEQTPQKRDDSAEYGFTRGADYYGRKKL
jgi:hypothetical protein